MYIITYYNINRKNCDVYSNTYQILTDNSWLKIDHHGPRYHLAGTRLVEEGVEAIIRTGDFVGWHSSVWLDSVFQTIQLPARIAHLDARLTHVHRYTLALIRGKMHFY